MKSSITQAQHEPYALYACAGCPWQVLVKQNGNEAHLAADFRAEWEGGAIFNLFPLEATEGETALVQICLAANAQASYLAHCRIPAVVRIEPAHHRILIELRCEL